MSARPVGDLDPALLGGPRPVPPDDVPRWRAALAWVRGAFLDDAGSKVVALLLSLTVFILVHSDESVAAGATVAVSFALPPGKVLVSPPVEQLRITVKGSRRRIRRFDSSELERVEIDLRDRGDGELVFTPEMIEGLPEGIELVSIAPPSMAIQLAERSERTVPIVVETEGAPAVGYRVASTVARPPRVLVVGAAATVGKVAAVRTEPVVVDGRRAPFAVEVELVPPEGTTLEGDGKVRIEVGFEEEQATRRIGPLPIEVRGELRGASAGAHLALEPAAVVVVLRGAASDLERIDPAGLTAFVKPSPAELSGGARPALEIHLAPALSGVGVELVPPAATARALP